MNEPDHYRILGVSPEAPRTEIQAAYRRRLREAHPDRGGTETAFHELQTAWETLSDPALRREYDLLRFGRRAARRYGRAAARPAHRKVRSWNVKPPPQTPSTPHSTGTLVAVPWYARLRRKRVTTRPSQSIELSIFMTLFVLWGTAGYAFCATAMATDAHIAVRALSIPLALAWGLTVVGGLLRRRKTDHHPPPIPKARLAAAGATATAAVWLAGPTQPLGWWLGLYALAGAAVIWPARRSRWAAGLRRTVGAALREYNAFGPAGSRPTADRRTGKLLREILTNLPASRLFVTLPVGGPGRASHAIVCGDRVALLAPPVGRGDGEVDADGLADAVTHLHQYLPHGHVHGWVLWPTLPEGGPVETPAHIDHAPAETAAADIGPWLAAGGLYYDLPILQALRTKLASVPAQRPGNPTPAVQT
ncbi:J domain-containing protein [Glycomyces xiaoerkulensis]|uniref:J domain-containing protein n=1 Tax=Glycomyces xiaoerkulensis TaxID=2038139 RepID=UPI0018E40B53|nr:J domain-containing protein [Glycomyces xiaoerkulensis]